MILAQVALPLAGQDKSKETEFRGQDAQRVAAWLKVSQDHAADYPSISQSLTRSRLAPLIPAKPQKRMDR
jgi:hypothetical protein